MCIIVHYVHLCACSNKECPTCRKKLVSKRSLRPDPNFDSLISKVIYNNFSCKLHQECATVYCPLQIYPNREELQQVSMILLCTCMHMQFLLLITNFAFSTVHALYKIVCIFCINCRFCFLIILAIFVYRRRNRRTSELQFFSEGRFVL